VPHPSLAKVTARHAGPCNRYPCVNRIAPGDPIYYSRATGAYCQPCGAEEAKARSAHAAAKSADASRRRTAAKNHQRVLAHVRAHGEVPAWWLEGRGDAGFVDFFLAQFREEAGREPKTVRAPCDCAACRPAGKRRAA